MREVVFFSYSHADQMWVRPLVDAVRMAGHFVFFDRDALGSGDGIPDGIGRAIAQASVGIVCLGPTSEDSRWVAAERAALGRAGARVLEARETTRAGELVEALGGGGVARPPQAIVLAAEADAVEASAAERALCVPSLPWGEARLELLCEALRDGRPLVLLWSRRAAGDPGVTKVLGEALMADIPRGAHRIHVVRLDDAPAHPLLAGVEEARSIDAVVRRLAPDRPARAAYAPIARSELADRYAEILDQQRRLLLLGPRGAGVRSLVAEVRARMGLPDEQVTWLSPPAVPKCAERDYFAALAEGCRERSALGYQRWQERRAGGRKHLIVLRHDGGPIDHLEALAAVLRALWDGTHRRYSILVAGGARAAQLRFQPLSTSLFSGMLSEHVPPLGLPEVADVLGRAGADGARHAAEVHELTDGHPGFLRELLGSAGPLVGREAVERLSGSAAVRAALNRRLQQDDADGRGDRHAAAVLEALLGNAGIPEPERLATVHDDLRFGEVRLFYDAIVREGPDGKTVLRGQAVRVAAERALAAWRKTRP